VIDQAIVGKAAWITIPVLEVVILARCYAWRPRLPWWIAWLIFDALRMGISFGLWRHHEWYSPFVAYTSFAACGLLTLASIEACGNSKRPDVVFGGCLVTVACGIVYRFNLMPRHSVDFVPAQLAVALICAACLLYRPVGAQRRILAFFCVGKVATWLSVALGAFKAENVFCFDMCWQLAATVMWLACVDVIARDSRLRPT
jgi:hypothetical protein